MSCIETNIYIYILTLNLPIKTEQFYVSLHEQRSVHHSCIKIQSWPCASSEFYTPTRMAGLNKELHIFRIRSSSASMITSLSWEKVT